MRIYWNEFSKSDWDPLAVDAPIQQHWAFGEALAAVGSPCLRAAVEIDGEIAALAQFSVGGVMRLAAWALCTRGPIWRQNLDDAARAEVLRRLRVSMPTRLPTAVFFMPNAPLGARYPQLAGLRRVMTGFSPIELDLTPGLDRLRAAMHGKWRNRLTAAEKAGLELRPIGRKRSQYAWLLDKEDAQKKAKGYMSPPSAITPAYQKAAGDKRALRIMGAFEGDQPVAAMMFLKHGAAATYHIGWSSDDGRRKGAHNLLLWEAVQSFRREGLKRLDLGEADTNTGAGLARFKLGAGGAPTTLCGAYV